MDVGAVTAAALRAVLTGELTQQAAPVVSATGAPLSLTVGGAAVSTIGGTPRLADIVRAAYDGRPAGSATSIRCPPRPGCWS